MTFIELRYVPSILSLVWVLFLHLCRKLCKSHTVGFRVHTGEEQRSPPPWFPRLIKSHPEGGSWRVKIISISCSALMHKVRLFSRTWALWLGFCGSSCRILDLLTSGLTVFSQTFFFLGAWIGSLSLLGHQSESAQCLSLSDWTASSHPPFSPWNPCHNPPSHPPPTPHQLNVPDIWLHLGMWIKSKLVEFTMKPSGPGLLFVGRFLITSLLTSYCSVQTFYSFLIQFF